VCDGRLFEAVNDGHTTAILAMYPKQPFDIDGRTGTAVFDVSADSDGTHAAWPAFWWTDQPIPTPSGGDSPPSLLTTARNGFGFSLSEDKCGGNPAYSGVDHIWVVRNYVATDVPYDHTGCVTDGTLTALNHFEVRINVNQAEIWGTDAGTSSIRRLAVAGNLNLPLTRGVIWIEDAHYNASKGGCACQTNHTFAWDNVGFDGPTTFAGGVKPYRDLTFDVQDATPPNLGYVVQPGTSPKFTLNGVSWQQTPTRVLVMFTWWSDTKEVPGVSVNGHPVIKAAWPGGDSSFWHTLAVEVPFSEVVSGTNAIQFTSSGALMVVSNINLALIAAAPAP
jgi:hypothetical protein